MKINNYEIKPGAKLYCANLRDANLYNADLGCANLRHANLRGADLKGANLRHANLSGADLEGANLRDADLEGANLSDAKLSDADLRDANLRRANLTSVVVSPTTLGYFLIPPQEGAYTAFKKADGIIIKLLITDDAKRSSATSRKCRASKAIVLEFIDSDKSVIASNWDKNFKYNLGHTVIVENFDEDRWNECSTGIHHFMTKEEAELW